MRFFNKVLSVIPFLCLLFFSSASSSHADFPIATTAGDEFSLDFAFDGTNYLIGIRGDGTSSANITAQRLSSAGTLVGARISVGRTGGGEMNGAPFVAFDGTNYLLLWTDNATAPNHDIYGQFVSTSGALVGTPFPVVQADGLQQLGGVVFDGTNYFLVWDDRRPSTFNDLDGNGYCTSPAEGTCRNIYGQLLTPAGALLGPQIPISTAMGEQRIPSVFFDGARYLVAWANQNIGPGEQWNIYGQFINTSGTLIGPPVVISETSSPSYNPVSIAHDGTNYLIVWNHDTGAGFGSPTVWDIHGRLLSFSGGFTGPEFTISAAAGSQVLPLVIFDGTNFVLTWTDTRNDANGNHLCDPGEGTCIDIYGQAISTSGALVGPEFPIIINDGSQVYAPIVYDGTKYLVYWTDGGVFFGTSGNVYGRFLDSIPTRAADLLIDFGPSYGLYARYNNTTWTKLHPLSAAHIAVGDMNGNGKDDVVADFGPSYGLYARYDTGTWTKLHPLSSTHIATGDLDGSGKDDLIADFGPSYGLYARYNNATWTKLHPFSAAHIAVGDMNGNGKDDLIVDFGPSYGLYARYDTGAWTKLNPLSSELIETGDLNGNGKDDVIVDFGPSYGLYVRYDTGAWTKVHPLSPAHIASADLDGNGKEDLIADFGPAYGIYARYNNSAWTKLHTLSSESMTTGDLDGDGKAELVCDFGSSGIHGRYNNGTWKKIHTLNPKLMATGNLDGN